jgi:uncharacterized protein
MTGALAQEATMKIQVNRIPPEGLHEEASYDPAPLDMGRLDIALREPIQVKAFIVKADPEVVVTAEIRCPLQLTCARCLAEFASTVTADAVFSYPATETDVIDITEDVRQEIILAYPMIPVCRPDCKGLCRVCGQDLNTHPCGHDQRPEAAGGSPAGENPVLR